MIDDKNTTWTRREIIQGVGVTAAELAAQRLLGASSGMSQPRSPEARFDSAVPIWPKGLEHERNLFVGFRASFEAPSQHPVLVRATGSTVYRIFVNGSFRGYGPARGPHEYYRVDEWDLTRALVEDRNWVAIEVAGYNVNSYYLLDQPSFLQAEVVAGDQRARFDGGAGRHGGHNPTRTRAEGPALQFPAPFSRSTASSLDTTDGAATRRPLATASDDSSQKSSSRAACPTRSSLCDVL